MKTIGRENSITKVIEAVRKSQRKTILIVLLSSMLFSSCGTMTYTDYATEVRPPEIRNNYYYCYSTNPSVSYLSTHFRLVNGFFFYENYPVIFPYWKTWSVNRRYYYYDRKIFWRNNNSYELYRYRINRPIYHRELHKPNNNDYNHRYDRYDHSKQNNSHRRNINKNVNGRRSSNSRR